MTPRTGLPEIEPIAGRRKPPLGVWVILKQTVATIVRHSVPLAVIALFPAILLAIATYYLAPGELLQTDDSFFQYEASPSVAAYGLYWVINLALGSLTAGAIAGFVANLRSGGVDGIRRSIAAALHSAAPLIICGSVATIATLAGIVAFVVPGIFLMVIWCVLVPSIVIEGSTYSCFRRSWQLTRGYRWRCFGVVIFSFLLDLVLFFGIVEPFRYLIHSTSGTDQIKFLLLSALYNGLTLATGLIAGTFVFFRLRQIKEGDIAGVFA